MKRFITLILALAISLSVFGLSGCSGDPNIVTLYEFKDSYEEGTPITKGMVKPVKVKISEGFVGANGNVYTAEALAQLTLITKDNWNTFVQKGAVLRNSVAKGSLFLVGQSVVWCTYEDILALYMDCRELYEAVLDLDAKAEQNAAGVGSKDYKALLEPVNTIYSQSVKLEAPSEYKQIYSMINIFLSYDLAIYCQKIATAIDQDSESELQEALKLKTLLSNDFVVITQTLIETGEAEGQDVSSIKNWSYGKGENWWQYNALHEFETIANEYRQARTVYEAALQLDYRIAAGIEDPLLIAPEYEQLLEKINNLAIQCQAISVSTQYTQLQNMLYVWITTDIAVYCQNMSAAISRNDASAADQALEYRTMVYNDFSVITANIAAMGAQIGADITDITEWSPEKYIEQQGTTSSTVTTTPNTPTEGQTTPTNPNTQTQPVVPDPTQPQNYTSTEVIATTEVKDDWLIIYETTVTKVYSSTGELLSVDEDGPKEVSRVLVSENHKGVPDPSKIAPTLHAECARVSYALVYKEDLAEQVLQIINTGRADANKPTLVINRNSEASLLATIKAGDMAIYNHSDYDSPMYGTAGELCERYEISVKDVVEIQWKAYNATAEEIARRLYLLHGELLDGDYTDFGLAIAEKGNYYYIDLITIQK